MKLLLVAVSAILLTVDASSVVKVEGVEDVEEVNQEQLFRDTVNAVLKFVEENSGGLEGVVEMAEDADANRTVGEIIENAGYPFEEHWVETEDGYILGVHRIPHGVKCGQEEGQGKRVVWLQHGLMGDSSNWIITGKEERGLAYELADACYDVWMGNFRGSTHSTNHTDLDPSDNKGEFWDFSLHDVGFYDVAANIDYALNITGEKELYYVGHSMGTTTFFILMTERPEYNAKVKLMSALAPVALMENTRSIPVRLVLPFLPELSQLLPHQEFLPIESTKALAASLCKTGASTQPLCADILGFIGGFNEAQLDLASLPGILGHSPAGSSSKVFIHYGQAIVSGDFKQFDYGVEENLVRYGNETPPSYNFSKMTAPTVMYYGENDLLADKIDVLRSMKAFPAGTIVHSHRVEDPFFNHLDFIFALDQHTLINKPIMDFMEQFTNPKPDEPNTTSGHITGGTLSSLLLVSLVLIMEIN